MFSYAAGVGEHGQAVELFAACVLADLEALFFAPELLGIGFNGAVVILFMKNRSLVLHGEIDPGLEWLEVGAGL